MSASPDQRVAFYAFDGAVAAPTARDLAPSTMWEDPRRHLLCLSIMFPDPCAAFDALFCLEADQKQAAIQTCALCGNIDAPGAGA